MNKTMKELTKAEEQVMQVLWDLEKGFVKDIIEKLPTPKPAYNTVSTIVRILEKKEFVGHQSYGKSHEYYPLIPRDTYRKFTLKSILSNYFGGSFEKMASFFVKQENLSLEELDQMMQHVKKDLEK